MSLCDKCTNPGQCCSGFPLIGIGTPNTYLEALVLMATAGNAWDSTNYRSLSDSTVIPNHSVTLVDKPPAHQEHIWLGLPFMPLYKTEKGDWKYWCQHLDLKGRCMIYEDRPPLCRAYEPGCDKMCAMYVKPNDGDENEPAPEIQSFPG